MSQNSDPYFCIVALPDQPVADLCVIAARDDAAALSRAAEIARDWSGSARIEVFQGERPVGVLQNAPAAGAPLARAA